MYGALKGTSIDAVTFVGVDNPITYPGWLNDVIFGWGYRRLSGGSIGYCEFAGEEDNVIYQTLTPFKHIIIRNLRKEILICDLAGFEKDFVLIGSNRAALKEDCIEFFEHGQNTLEESLPEWLSDKLYRDYYIFDHNAYDTLYFKDGGNRVIVAVNSVFIRNRLGDVTYMNPVDFSRIFETGESRVYSDILEFLKYKH